MHNLEYRNNRYSMFYTGETPWHELGKKVNRPLTAAEALEEAQLNYQVLQSQIVFSNGKENIVVPDKVVNYREDTGQYLGTVGNRYSVIQNKDAFSFFDSLVDEGEAIYHTAGVLGNGETVWILAKLPENILGPDGKSIEEYVVLTNSHDGGRSLSVVITPIRVVCNNTLNLALEKATNRVNIRHSGDIKAKLREAHKVLGLTKAYYDTLPQVLNRLHDVFADERTVGQFVQKMFPENKEAKNNTRTENLRNELANAIYKGEGQNIDQTLYWLLNGAVYYADNHKKYTKPDTRLNNAVFNPLFKDRAFKEISNIFETKTGYKLN